jgi:hypothetical protein
MLFQPEYGKPKNFINWDKLCRNPNPNAIYILEQHLDKINWANLSENIYAIHLLEKNLDKIWIKSIGIY